MAKAFAFNGNVVLPETQQAGGAHYSEDASSSNYIIVHCQHQLTHSDSEKLAASHVTVLNFIGNNTYICKYEPKDLERIRSFDFVLSANVYHQDLVVNASLKGKSISPEQSQSQSADVSTPIQAATMPSDLAAESVEMSIAQEQTPTDPDEPVRVFIKLHPGTNEETALVKSEIAGLTGIPESEIYQDGHSRLQTTLRAKHLATVAAVDEVQTIEEILPIQFHIHVSRKDLRVMNPYWFNKGISTTLREGTDEVVAVTDSGFDNYDNAGQWDPHPHPLFPVQRIEQIVPMGNRVPASSSDNNAHGTHVAGCILGQGNSTFGLTRGTAPGARLVLQSINNAAAEGQYPLAAGGGLTNMYMGPYNNNGARIHSMSWGGGLGPRGVQQQYNTGAEIVDEVMFDHDDYLIVYCAGNDGQTKNPTAQVGGESAAKNALVVGAVESSRPLAEWDQNADDFWKHSDLYYTSRGRLSGNCLSVAYFSSRGRVLGPDGETSQS
jgi:serine protease AprX